jgi:hypothetical protein
LVATGLIFRRRWAFGTARCSAADERGPSLAATFALAMAVQNLVWGAARPSWECLPMFRQPPVAFVRALTSRLATMALPARR